jgi:hypothetical protein
MQENTWISFSHEHLINVLQAGFDSLGIGFRIEGLSQGDSDSFLEVHISIPTLDSEE